MTTASSEATTYIGLGTDHERRILSDPDVKAGIAAATKAIEEWRKRNRAVSEGGDA